MAGHIPSAPCLPHSWDTEAWALSWDLLGLGSTSCSEDIKHPLRCVDIWKHDSPSRTLKSPAVVDHSLPAEADGALERIADMPLEIVYEIFSHLGPFELLHLTWTSHRIRELLMSRENARFIWRSALASVKGLPSCPPDMNEPQYAKLAFDSSCHFCSSKGVDEVFWLCRVRCCSNCIKQQFVTEDELDCWIPEEMYVHKYGSVFPYAVVNQGNLKQSTTALYFAPLAKRYLEEAAQILSSTDEKGLEEWLKAKREAQLEKIKHASLCERWHNLRTDRPPPSLLSRIPLFDISVSLVLSVALILLWKDKLVS